MLEMTEAEQTIMSNKYCILNFMSNSSCGRIAGKYYGINDNGNIFGSLDALSQNVKDTILNGQGQYFNYGIIGNFGIELDRRASCRERVS